ncbi:hypothetical protein SAMN05660199_01158 [Klenkia soli]|uniref:Uncharacterized protein n=1 Tax=Klenkia soli TaxID=1052260 RepID=A0A1H0G728_9ACTN|nr:hypothetical protein [Klenkia soli]SDO02666.1 hypothetical protein SAMN05660199_01158 [Klenkia soli]
MSDRKATITKSQRALHAAAVSRGRVRVRGQVDRRGDGYSGTYRNVWLIVDAGGAFIRITASPSSPLGAAPVGGTVELTTRLTGNVDLGTVAAGNIYRGERAQVIDLNVP